MSIERFRDALAPLLELISTLDPADDGAAAALEARYPLASAELETIAGLFAEGVAEGWLCDRKGSEHVSYSRVHKSTSGELSVDAVRMTGPGPGHTHPRGEFDLCIPVLGEPTFDGHAPGWVVYPPGSWHVPTVAGGTMNILYFLPDGAIEFGPRQ